MQQKVHPIFSISSCWPTRGHIGRYRVIIQRRFSCQIRTSDLVVIWETGHFVVNVSDLITFESWCQKCLGHPRGVQGVWRIRFNLLKRGKKKEKKISRILNAVETSEFFANRRYFSNRCSQLDWFFHCVPFMENAITHSVCYGIVWNFDMLLNDVLSTTVIWYYVFFFFKKWLFFIKWKEQHGICLST